MSDSVVVVCLNALSAAAALVAAFFWFRSVTGTMPPRLSYFGETPPTDPYSQAVNRNMRFSRTAAKAACASALAQVLAFVAPFIAHALASHA